MPGPNIADIIDHTNKFADSTFKYRLVRGQGRLQALGFAAQDRRSRPLARILIAAEAIIAVVALFDLRHFPNVLGLLILSARTRTLVESLGIENAEFLSVKLKNHKNQVVADDYAVTKPRGGYGEHSYRFEDHGLNEQKERAKFRPYMVRFGVTAEAAPKSLAIRPTEPASSGETQTLQS